MTKIFNMPHNDGIEFIGPFSREYFKASVDGYLVPHIEVMKREGSDQVTLILDGRFMIDCTELEARRFMWFIANAMAISAGFSCHGKNCTKLNPHMVRISSFGDPAP